MLATANLVQYTACTYISPLSSARLSDYQLESAYKDVLRRASSIALP